MFHFMLFDGKIDSHALYEITITNQETFKDHNKGLKTGSKFYSPLE